LLDRSPAVQGQKRSVDLSNFGLIGYVLMEKSPGCQPLSIVDTSTGFFTDIFPMLPMLNPPTATSGAVTTGNVMVPFWWGKTPCDTNKLFPPCSVNKCQTFTLAETLPPSFCPMVGDPLFTCAKQLYPWLVQQFGPSVYAADRPTRVRPGVVAAVASTATKKAQLGESREHVDRPVRQHGVSAAAGHQEDVVHSSGKVAFLEHHTSVQRQYENDVAGAQWGLLSKPTYLMALDKHGVGFFAMISICFLMVPFAMWIFGASKIVVVFTVYIALYMTWSMLTHASRNGIHNSAILVLNSLILKITICVGLWRSWQGSAFSELPGMIWKSRSTIYKYSLPAGLYAIGDVLRVEALRATDPWYICGPLQFPCGFPCYCMAILDGAPA